MSNIVINCTSAQSLPPIPLTRPIRVTTAEIQSGNIDRYIVLPVPPQSNPIDFEAIGRTSFKKYVTRLYSELFSLEPNFLDIPFVVLREATEPYIVRGTTEPIGLGPTMDMNIDMIGGSILAPPHHEATRFKMSTSNDLDIVITNNNPRTYFGCSAFDTMLAQSGDFWHMIVIHHDGLFNKTQILDNLFDFVSDSDFFPVAYTQSMKEDYFLLRLCRTAIEKFFQSNLTIKICNQHIPMTIKFQVAQFKLGQIYPSKKYMKALTERSNQLVTCEGITSVLNLDRFSQLPEFEQITVNLGNKMSLQLLFTSLDNLHTSSKIFEKVKGLRLINNGIKSMDAVAKLQNISLDIIDLRNNNIRSVQDLAKMRRIKCKHLYLDGNPCTSSVSFRKDIREMFPQLETVDNFALNKIDASMPTPMRQQTTIEVTNHNELLSYKDTEHNVRNFQKYKVAQNHWHQVIVMHNGKYSQIELLDAIYEAIAPNDILPCYYKSDATYDSFFVRDAYDALELLYEKKLVLRTERVARLEIVVKMCAAPVKDNHINPTKIIESTIIERFDAAEKTLDLSRFVYSEAMLDVICRMSVPRTLTTILTFVSRKYGLLVERVLLNDNDLQSARGMHPMLWMKNLKEVDLSNNKIDDIKQIEAIPKSTITAIWLQGNPLCLSYSNPTAYIAAVKDIIKNLEKLDGNEIAQPLFMTPKQNFICSLDGYDLVDQFVTFYFNSFDSTNRTQIMRNVYHKNAILTMSINSLGMPDSIAKRMAPIIDKCRNFKRVVASQSALNVFQGNEMISALFCAFGQTEHDYTSFTIDMTSYTPTRAVITVNGLFRESGSCLNEEDLFLGFSRTFVICSKTEKLGMFHASEEFQITNDILLFYRPTIQQINSAFGTVRIADIPDDDEATEDDKQGLEIIFHELTGLNSTWCKKFLSTASWNFRESLESFKELYEQQCIPADAFA